MASNGQDIIERAVKVNELTLAFLGVNPLNRFPSRVEPLTSLGYDLIRARN